MTKKGDYKTFCLKHNKERLIKDNRSFCKLCLKEKGLDRFFKRNNFISNCKSCKKQYGLDVKTFNRYIGISVNLFCSKQCQLSYKKRYKFEDDRYKTVELRCKKLDIKYEKIDRQVIYRKYNYKCNICGIVCKIANSENYNDLDCATIDHIIPKLKGGTHTYDNVQLLCRNCNNKKYITIL